MKLALPTRRDEDDLYPEDGVRQPGIETVERCHLERGEEHRTASRRRLWLVGRRADGLTGRQADGWTDGRTDEQTYERTGRRASG